MRGHRRPVVPISLHGRDLSHDVGCAKWQTQSHRQSFEHRLCEGAHRPDGHFQPSGGRILVQWAEAQSKASQAGIPLFIQAT